MVAEQFDDKTLMEVATRYYKAGCYDEVAYKILDGKKSKLSNIERNLLIRYVKNFNNLMFDKASNGMSMRQMRDGLLEKCGRPDLIPEDRGSYQNVGNINAAQLKAIYFYVMGLGELEDES